MPADRFLHPRLGHSHRVTMLTDLEYRTWTQYILSADDFGVMRASAVSLQADNDALAAKKTKIIERCIEALVKSELVVTFQHQGRRFMCQRDWQDFQKVDYPRPTMNPQPPAELLETFSKRTRDLFLKHPGGTVKGSRNGGGTVPESSPAFVENSPKVFLTDPHYARARAREMAKAKANGLEGVQGKQVGEDPTAVFIREVYPRVYAQVRHGAHFAVNEARDYEVCDELVRTYGPERLPHMLELFLRMQGRDVLNQPGTPRQLKHMAPTVDAELRKNGL